MVKQNRNKTAGLMSYTALKQDHVVLHVSAEHTLEETKM